MSNLIKQMKERIAKSGSSKKEVLYFAPDSVKRIRFLEELDEGKMVNFHSDFNAHIYEICKGDDCDLCEKEVPILEQYAWSVWDYDSNAVRILLTKATGISPIPQLIELYEEYGTLLDRDIKIKKVGKGTGGSYAVTPLDKSRFRNNAKPFTEKQMNEILIKAFGSSPDFKNDEEEPDEKKYAETDEELPTGRSEKKKAKKKEKSLRDKYLELDEDDLRDICSDIGMPKKEIRSLETVEDIVAELFENYEEEDLEEILEEFDE